MEEVSLRPMSLRPGAGGLGANPFASFAKGAGIKSQAETGAIAAHDSLREERKKVLGGKAIKYTADFMNKFATKNTRCPGVLHAFKGLVLDEDERRSAQQSRVAENNNWRPSGASAPAPAANANPNAAAGSTTAAAPTRASGPEAKAPSAASSAYANERAQQAQDVIIQKATDIGRKAWQPAKDLAGSAGAAKLKLRGILNKLTPDNFDRLVVQVLSIMAASSEIMKTSIPLIFEKAVAEPKFCVLYADLCTALASELASTDYGESEGKPMTFKRELLNTCQDEFEGMEEQRAALPTSMTPEDRYATERARHALKMRQLGTVNLLSELFNKDLVTHPIMRIVVQELMTTSLKNGVFDSELIESIVQAVSIAGAKMAQSEKIGKHLKEWLKTLGKWSDDPALEARIRFKIKDLLDQVRAGWETRHEKNTVKKTSDIRAQAHAELGMIQSNVPDFLQNMPIGGRATAKAETTTSLFPGMNEYGMPMDGLPNLPSPGVPMRATDNSDPAQADPKAKEDAAPAGPPKGQLSEEDITNKANGTFAEYLQLKDAKEAVLCVNEMAPSVEQEGQIVKLGIEAMFNAQNAAQQALLTGLIVHLHDVGCLTTDGVRQGIQAHTDNLEDLAMDVPLSPMLIGKLLAAFLAGGLLPISCIEPLLAKCESTESKRHLMRFAFQKLAEELGEETAARMCTEGDLHVGPILDADAEFEPDMPSVKDYLKIEGLTWVPL